MRKGATSIALAGLLALAACSGTTGGTTSEALTGTTLAGTAGGTDASSDALAAVAAFQEDIQALSDAISESDSPEELRSAWDTLNAELTASVEIDSRGRVHRPGGDRGEFGCVRAAAGRDRGQRGRPHRMGGASHQPRTVDELTDLHGRGARRLHVLADREPGERHHDQAIDQKSPGNYRPRGLSPKDHVVEPADPEGSGHQIRHPTNRDGQSGREVGQSR